MKKIILSLIALFVVFAWRQVFAGFLVEFERGNLPNIKEPPIKSVTLENGMRCFLLEDHSLPMVRIGLMTRVGDIYSPPEKVGLAGMMGLLMRSGSAGDLSPENFDKAVDDLGMILNSGVGLELGEVSLEVLSEDLEKAAGLMFDMVFKPRFDPERMKTVRLNIEESLRRENDDPNMLAGRHFKWLVYGKENPWARRPEPKGLRSITQGDLKAFHREYFKTGNMILAAAGDFKTNDFIKLINRLMKNAPAGKPAFPEVEKVKLEFEPGKDEVIRPMTQSFIRIGHLGIKRDNPDKFALMLMNDILGANNFKSRLMSDIRSERGLAYSVGSGLTLGTDYGLFVVDVNTKFEQAAKVIELVRAHIERLKKGDDILKGELDFAKQAVLSSLVFEFDSSFKAVDRRATYYFYGYPDDYWRIFRDRISRVGPKEVRAVAQKYLHPEGLKTVIVGPKIEGL